MDLRIVFILLTVLIDAMGIGLAIPVMPDLIREVTGQDLSHAALWGGFLASIFALMQFLFGPFMGNLSDRFGRRPVLLIALAVMAADYLLMALAGTVWLLVLGRIIGGITAATQATATAYLADITDAKKKSQVFGWVGAAFGLGFVLGPFLGGILAGFGTRAPFYAACILTAACCLLGVFVLKETVTDATRRPFNLLRANPLGAFYVLGRLPGIGRGLMIFFLYQVAFGVYPAVWAYFGQAQLGWSPREIGLSLGLFGIMMALVQAALMPFVIRIFGERGTVIFGMVVDIFAFTLVTQITSGTVMMIFVPLATLGGVITPAMQSLMSQSVGSDQQGELQGAITSVSALALMVAYSVMTRVFSMFTESEAQVFFPGAPFVLSAALMVIALIVFLIPSRRRVTAPMDT